MNRRSKPWSLETLRHPWASARPLYETIAKSPDVPLLEEDSGTRVKWAAGALDGIMGHHAGRGDATGDVRRVLDSVRALLGQSSDANLRRLYDAVCKAPLLGYVDELLPAIEGAFPSESARLAAVARYFVLRAPRRGPVKFGIAILGISGSARAGRLHEALRVNPRDPSLLNSAADLLLAMITGGPAEDIDDYEHASEAVEAYLDAVWVQSSFNPKYFVVVDRIREWLRSNDGWEQRSKCGWSLTNRDRCLLLSQELLKKEEWKPEALRDLASPDASVFHWANRASQKLGVDTWDVLFAKVEADPILSTFWCDLTEATDRSRIDRLISFAEQVLPLDEIGSGPSDAMGLGPGFEPHGVVDWMLQLLVRFPGRGWKLIRAGLQSPVVRNRHWSLRVFKNWRRDDWPADASQVLRAAANAEPDDELRKDLEAFLESARESAQ